MLGEFWEEAPWRSSIPARLRSGYLTGKLAVQSGEFAPIETSRVVQAPMNLYESESSYSRVAYVVLRRGWNRGHRWKHPSLKIDGQAVEWTVNRMDHGFQSCYRMSSRSVSMKRGRGALEALASFRS